MSVWHGNQHKRKHTGGKRRASRRKRRFERGSFPTETVLGENKIKLVRRHGGNTKIRLVSTFMANVSNESTGKTSKVEIQRVIRNPANIDYNRRGVITKGSLIETSIGRARVTSRPGQNGILNAVLISEAKE